MDRGEIELLPELVDGIGRRGEWLAASAHFAFGVKISRHVRS
jgi:hypothetical protein